MKKILPLLEKDLLFCFKSIKFYIILAFCFCFSIMVISRLESAYVEYIIVLCNLWVFSIIFMELLIYRDIIKNRIPHLLAFGYNIFDLMLSKSIFITLFSLYITFMFVAFFRVMSCFFNYSYTFVGIWNFLLLVPILFFIVLISVYLLFKFQISRPIRFVLIAVFLLLSKFKGIITRYSSSSLAVIGLVALFIIGNILIIKFLGGLKNEDII